MFAHTLPLTRLHHLSPRPPLFHTITYTSYSVHQRHLYSSLQFLFYLRIRTRTSFSMDDQIITPTGVDQNNDEAVTTTTATSTATTTQPRRSKRLLENQNIQATTTNTPHAGTRPPRVPRPIDPVQRRKKGQSAHQFPHHASSPPHLVLSLLSSITESY